MKKNRQHFIPVFVFLIIIAVLMCLVAGICLFGSPLAKQIAMRKMCNCFAGWQGLVALVLLTAMCLITGRSVTRKAFAEMSLAETWLLFPAMAFLSFAIGWTAFETSSFTHEMWRWDLHNYLQVMGGNMGLSFLPTALVIIVSRPWRFVPDVGITRVVSTSTALLLLNYFVAFLAYVVFPCYKVE